MSTLFNTFKVGDLTLKNRVVMAPMTRSHAGNDENKANDLIALYYAQRASAGLLISEGTPVSPLGVGYIDIPGIYSPAQVDAWKTVTDKVHRNNGAIYAQLWHVGRISHPDLLQGETPLAPSAINPEVKAYTRNGFTDTITPKAMTQEDIETTINDFQQAAVNAIAAGFDGIEIHAANGYLFNQFFMKCSNTREDAYGGSIENRVRFLVEVIERIGEKVPLSKVGVRISPELHGPHFGIYKDDETEALYEYMTQKLNTYHLAYLHLSGLTGDVEDPAKVIWNMAKKFRNSYQGALMINGGFTKALAEKALEQNLADLVSFGAPYIANPDLVERFEQNAPLNEVNRAMVYGTNPEGFTDYPTLQPQQIQ